MNLLRRCVLHYLCLGRQLYIWVLKWDDVLFGEKIKGQEKPTQNAPVLPKGFAPTNDVASGETR